MAKIETNKHIETSWVLLTSVPDVFFLVEEPSEAGQVSQPVPSQPQKHMFGGKVNVCRCHVNVCWCHEFRFKNKAVIVKNFQSNSNQFFGHLDSVK